MTSETEGSSNVYRTFEKLKYTYTTYCYKIPKSSQGPTRPFNDGNKFRIVSYCGCYCLESSANRISVEVVPVECSPSTLFERLDASNATDDLDNVQLRNIETGAFLAISKNGVLYADTSNDNPENILLEGVCNGYKLLTSKMYGNYGIGITDSGQCMTDKSLRDEEGRNTLFCLTYYRTNNE